MPAYLALLRKDPDSDYGVDFPDFLGCITAGSTLEEARRMAEEALRGHIACMIEDGEPIPEPSDLERVMADPHNRDAIAFLVTVPEPTQRTIRVNISIPESDLKAIDAYVAAHGMTRSGFLVEAARRVIRGPSAVSEPSRPRNERSRSHA